jgi:hypothetical protein
MKVAVTVSIYPVAVNYDALIEYAIEAGQYGHNDSDVTNQNFTPERKGTADLGIILVKFDKELSSEEALRQLDKRGLRPATFPELLAFGRKYPDVQREFGIVALGSVWHYLGQRRVLFLTDFDGKRSLQSERLNHGKWNSICRFAAVRKSRARKVLVTGIFNVKLGGATTTDDIVKEWEDTTKAPFNNLTQKNFPLTPHAEEIVEIEIFDPGDDYSDEHGEGGFSEEEGLACLEASELERPTYEHALRFAEQWGRVTTFEDKPFILFLHEPWSGRGDNCAVVEIDRGPNDRSLHLRTPHSDFNNVMLAGVRRHADNRPRFTGE